jgi:RNA polymerase sigma-70 factor, ECF subfamily
MDPMASPALRLVKATPASAASGSPERAPESSVHVAPSALQRPGSANTEPADKGPEDRDLVERVLANDRHAFELLYRRHAGFAFGLVVRLQGSKLDAEDVVHDAFLRVRSELTGLRDAGAFRAWLGSIVVSQVRMRLRKGRLLRALGLATQDPVDLDSLASEVAGPEVRAQLAQLYALLRVLPADERIAWTLRHVERHRLEEVAELTECSLATAKRRLLRAQQFLRDHFVPVESEESNG